MRRLISILSCLPACVLAAPYGEPVVKPDSEVVRDIYRQPLTADPAPLVAARAILDLAEDARGKKALDAHLGRMGFAMVTGAPLPEGGTVGELTNPAKERQPVPQSEINRILDASLRAKVDQVLESKRIHASIQSAGQRPFRLFESGMRLGQGPDAVDMTCEPFEPTWRSFEPGESRRYDCGVSGNMAGLEGFFRDFANANPPGTPLPIRAVRIEFDDPPLSLSAHGASWVDRNAIARGLAIEQMRAVSCEKRGDCADVAWRHLTDRPHILAALVGVAIGLVAGAVIGFTARRRRRAAGIVSALGVAGGFAFSVAGGSAMGGTMGALVLGFLALVGSVAFLLALWVSIAAFEAFRPAPV